MKSVDMNCRNVMNNNVQPDSEFINVDKTLSDAKLYTGG
jgi:hypothetical protein